MHSQFLVIPLEGGELVVLVDDGEGVKDVAAEEGVDVLGEEGGGLRAVLRPIRVVAEPHVVVTCRRIETVITRIKYIRCLFPTSSSSK